MKNSLDDEQQRLVTEKLLSAQLGRLYLLAAGAAQSKGGRAGGMECGASSGGVTSGSWDGDEEVGASPTG